MGVAVHRRPLGRLCHPRALAVAALVGAGACGPSGQLPPDAGSRFPTSDGSSTNDPDSGEISQPDGGVIVDPDSGVVTQPDSGETGGCSSDPEGDTEGTAVSVDEITDCDDDAISLEGTLDGAGDVDYFRVPASDTSFCVADPSVTSRTAPNMCLYLDCPLEELTCDLGVQGQSPDGLQGCCNAGGIEVTFDCEGSDDSLDMYLEVSGATPGECLSYEIDELRF